MNFTCNQKEMQMAITISFSVERVMLMCLSQPGKAFRRGISLLCALARHLGETLLNADSLVRGRAVSETNTETGRVCGSPLHVGSCNKSLKFIKIIFLGFGSFQKRAYGLFEDRSSPCHDVADLSSVEKKQNCHHGLYRSDGRLEKGEITGNNGKEKSQFVTQFNARKFYQVSPKENEG